MRKSLDEAFAGNETLLKKICAQVKTQYVEEDPKKCLDELFQAMKSHLMSLSEREGVSGQVQMLEQQSAYAAVAARVIGTVMFTLTLEPNQHTLKPLGLMNRSFSCPCQPWQKQETEKKSNLLQVIRYNQPSQTRSYETSEVEHIVYGLVKAQVDCA